MFPEMKFWGSATVGAKGQVVIPAEAREELNIKEGEKLIVVGSAKVGIVSFVKPGAIEQMMTFMHNDLMKIQKSVEADERSEAE